MVCEGRGAGRIAGQAAVRARERLAGASRRRVFAALRPERGTADAPPPRAVAGRHSLITDVPQVMDTVDGRRGDGRASDGKDGGAL
ncbi:hypothetical protein A6A06_20530 [Streptomyces sp. CB02923]|nr:hypothetical protein A6A06_20530 [Streptomyces sp. CB02923]